MSPTLRELLEAPLRRTHLGGHRKQFSFDPDEAIRRWRSGGYPSIQALANELGVDRTCVSRLLRDRGAIG